MSKKKNGRRKVPGGTAKAGGRLRPGELDDLVLAYMREHSEGGALTASAIAKGIGRSSGAVANCLKRLAKAKRARQAKRKPRAYDLKVGGRS